MRCEEDKSYFFENLLHIKTKEGEISPFILNSEQVKLQAKIEELERTKGFVRLIVLKARQIGVSTLTEANLFYRTSQHPNITSQIVAHDVDGSDTLFGMSKLFYDMLTPEYKPLTRYSNRKELIFENPKEKERFVNPGLRSKIIIDTANSLTTGRSKTIHNLHASELAFWRDAEELMTGLMQSVPNSKKSFVVLESTANGIGDYWHDEWIRASEGESDFFPYFIPWFSFEEYRLAAAEAFYSTGMSDEEKYLKRVYKLTDDQLNWRRYMIRTNLQGDVEKFKQEYPASASEAFIIWGTPFFNMDALAYFQAAVSPASFVGEILKTKTGYYLDKNSKGRLHIWEYPKRGRRYVLGADVAEGLQVKGRETDYSAACVIDLETYNLVAVWHGKEEPDIFGKICGKLGGFYNEALLGIEVNGSGLTTNNAIKGDWEVDGVKCQAYPFIYIWQWYDERGRKYSRKIGWETNSRSRPLLLDALARFIREKAGKMPFEKLVREALTFTKDSWGRPEAQAGCHDDLVFAMGIALMMAETDFSSQTKKLGRAELTYEEMESPLTFTGTKLRNLIMGEAEDKKTWEEL